MVSSRRTNAISLILLCIFLITIIHLPLTSQLVQGQTEQKNVILIGWDGVQRNHLYELLNRNLLSNLASFANQGVLVNITVTDHATDTKAGWTQILTGYRWWRTGVYSNVYWFNSIPAGYTIHERAENYFGKNQIVTGFRVGKLYHMEISDGTGDTTNGKYTGQAIYRNLQSTLDIVTNGDKNSTTIGNEALTFIENRANNHFFAFLHFSDPDTAGHFKGGENSEVYEQAIINCDIELGRILDKLNSKNLMQKTLIYLAVDHGFDEGGTNHLNAPYVFLASNDKNVVRNGDQIDIAPTIYYGLGMWGQNFNPPLNGYPLQMSLPQEEEQTRQKVLSDLTAPPKVALSSPTPGALVDGKIDIVFNVTDPTLSAVLLLTDNTLVADGPWTWQYKDKVEASGSYSWDTINVSPGSHTITILAFDEHGSNNAPSTTTITVNKPASPTLPPSTTSPTPYPTTPATIKPTATSQSSTTPTPTSTLKPTNSSHPSITSQPQTTDTSIMIYGAIGAAAAIAIMSATVIMLKRRK